MIKQLRKSYEEFISSNALWDTRESHRAFLVSHCGFCGKPAFALEEPCEGCGSGAGKIYTYEEIIK